MANGLIDLQTDLKSLKYSSMPLGSQNPYVRKNIGDGPETQIGLEFQRRVDDTSRIAQMLIDKPGIQYLLSEAALQQINVQSRIERAQDGGKTLTGAILQQLGNTVINTVKIAASTLAQIPVNGTGTHLLKGFRTDTYYQPTGGNTRSQFAQFFGAGGVEGAPLALRGKPIEGEVTSNLGEISGITGKFSPTPSKFDYNGEVFPDSNEIKNIPKEDWASKEFYNSTLAARGQVIPVSKTEIRPVQATNADTGEATTLPGFNIPVQQPGIETTAQPGVKNPQSSIVSISHLDSVQADIQPDSINNISSQQYSSENGYTFNTPDVSINNAQAGLPIPVDLPEIEMRETTAQPGNIGIAIDEANGSSTVPGEDIQITPFKVEDQLKKSTNDTEQNILNAIDGYPIPLQQEELDGIQGLETTPLPGDLKSISNNLPPDTTTHYHPARVGNIFLEEPQNPANYADGTTPTYLDEIIDIIENGPESQAIDSPTVEARISRDISTSELLADNGNNGEQKYSPENTYTKTNTRDNINTILNRTGVAGIGQPGRIYLGEPEVLPGNGGAVSDTILREDSFLTLVKYGDTKGITDLTAFPLPLQKELLYVSESSGEQTILTAPNTNPPIQDFRKNFGIGYSFDYNSAVIKKEKRVNLGDQGKKKSIQFLANYSNVDVDAIDTINVLDVGGRRNAAAEARDLAKFYFEIITPDGSKFLYFRAFIDSIDDSFNADWQGFNYVGRGEKFYTYGGFERDISVSFKVAAATRSELRPLHNKMVYLASATAPTYGTQGFMRGTLAKITIGSYFDQIPGIITSVKYSLIDDLPWEIAMQDPEGKESGVEELPTGLQCSVSFKAIHNFAPRTGLLAYFSDPKPAPPIQGLAQTQKTEEEKAQEQQQQQAQQQAPAQQEQVQEQASEAQSTTSQIPEILQFPQPEPQQQTPPTYGPIQEPPPILQYPQPEAYEAPVQFGPQPEPANSATPASPTSKPKATKKTVNKTKGKVTSTRSTIPAPSRGTKTVNRSTPAPSRGTNTVNRSTPARQTNTRGFSNDFGGGGFSGGGSSGTF